MSDEYWTVAELRAFLKVEGPRKYKTWWRLKPFFAPAMVVLPPNYRLYKVSKVHALLDGRFSRHSPLAKKRTLMQIPA
jgi:hypothetical protein